MRVRGDLPRSPTNAREVPCVKISQFRGDFRPPETRGSGEPRRYPSAAHRTIVGSARQMRLLVCHTVFVSVNAAMRARLGAAASGPFSGGSTRVSVSAAAI